MGALIAHRLSTNHEKGGVCGGLIASRLLAYHQLDPPLFDIELPVFRLDVNSMIRHRFVPSWATLEPALSCAICNKILCTRIIRVIK